MTGQSADGILVIQRVTSEGAAPLTVEMRIDATRMRTEMAGPNGTTNVTIFDGGKQVLYTIDPARKTYTELTKADVDRLSAQMQGAVAQTQSQLEKLPPAQRAQMDTMMKGVQLTRTRSDTVGRWTCDNHDVMLGGQKIGERCTVQLATLGFSETDFDVMLQMGAFYSAMASLAPGQPPGVSGIDRGGGSDFPVRTVLIFPGGTTTTTELVEARRQTFPDSLFAVPAGFTKQEFTGATGGRDAGAKR
jgi:hypothetical protein